MGRLGCGEKRKREISGDSRRARVGVTEWWCGVTRDARKKGIYEES